MIMQDNDFMRIDEKPTYCSMTPKTFDEKKMLFNAMSSPDLKLRECINLEINVKDVYCEIVSITTEDGEQVEAPRIVLIDTQGTSYQCVSMGVMNSLKRLFVVFGYPTWEEGIKVKVKQISSKERQLLSLVVA